MAIELKQSLRLSQQLVITPQLQQAIKLLQLSRLELANLIQKELLENPILEESSEEEAGEDSSKTESEKVEASPSESQSGDKAEEVGTKEGELTEPNNFDWENYLGIYNAPGYPVGKTQLPDDLPTYENTIKQTESLQDHLFWQLHMADFTDEEEEIASEIIGNINDDGYFSISIQEQAKQLKIDEASVEKVLKKVQSFDPAGVGTRNLKECLLLQTKLLGENGTLVAKLIEEHLPELENHKYSIIAKKQKLPIDKVKEIVEIIQSMEPKPGRPYNSENIQYITPDVYVYKIGDDYTIVLNEDGLPKLQVSNLYRRTLMDVGKDTNTTKEYIQDKLRSAMWLIKSIHQRQRTMYKVTESIIKFQRDFFDKGINFLRPMVLKDVAEDIDMHESTISRVTTNKYVHTPRGIFELKYFFNSSINKTEGDSIASEAVKTKIKKLIDNEDPTKPLSDNEIAKMLMDNNIDIARRTVAKYRENLKVLPSSKRRREG
ncbi:RNA polymerase factor sigma-54 [bacterium]|nr:RNA polymerase factor sigma-54 [bacterium]